MINIKELIKEKGFTIGSWINSGSTIIAEIMAEANFDFLVIDLEHSPTDVENSILLFQAIKAGNRNCFPMVRLQGNNYAENKRFLDAGAMGVIAPLIKTKEEVEEVIRSVKYPPLGERGVGYCRANGYGFSFDEYINNANENTFICIQIEHIQSVNNIDSLFSNNFIDAAFIGP